MTAKVVELPPQPPGPIARKRILRNAKLWAGKAKRATTKQAEQRAVRRLLDRLYELLGRR